MAVENKFRRNFLAASILVGLSLSAASGVARADDGTDKTEATTGVAMAAPESSPVLGGSESLSSKSVPDGEGTDAESLSASGNTGSESTEEGDKISSAVAEKGDVESNSGADGEKGATEKEGVPDSGSETISKTDDDTALKSDTSPSDPVATIEGKTKGEPPASVESGKEDISGKSVSENTAQDENKEVRGSDAGSDSPGKESSAEFPENKGGKTDESKEPGLIEKIVQVGKDAIDSVASLLPGGESETDGTNNPQSDDPDANSSSSSDVSVDDADKKPEIDGKPVVSEGDDADKKPEIDGKPVVSEGDDADKQPEIDGKPVVSEGDDADKQPEIDGKPVVSEGDVADKQPELDGKPVVSEGDDADKKPEIDGKPVVSEGDDADKKPEIDGKPVVSEGDDADKQPEIDGKPVVSEGDDADKKPELDGKPVVSEGDDAGKQPELDGKPVVDEKPAEKPVVQPVVKPVEPKRTYSAAELNNASSESKPLTEALPVNVAPSATDTAPVIFTVGEAASKGGKVTPSSIRAESATAVELTGNLRTAQPELDKDGKPVAGKVTREADKIVLQNLNIQNRVNEFVHDIAGIRVGTQTTSDVGTSVSAPKDANIVLDNVNITMQHDKGDAAKAIDLAGNSNHILAKGGVIDAGEGYNASALDISGSNNVVDFVGSTLKGDIKSGTLNYTSWMSSATPVPVDNTVNLKGSTLTGNAIAGTGSLSLVLDGSTWTGRSGLHSPDITLRNGSVWNVTGSNAGAYGVWSEIPYSSVNSLNLYGSNTLNLIAPPEGKGQLGGRGFVGDGDNRSRMLQVDTDLKSDGKGITTVNIGAYSPGTLHRLNNTGIGDDYAFGRIEVDGLALGGKYRLNVESSGAEPYTIGGRLADDADATGAHGFVSYKTSENRPVTNKDGKVVSQVVKSDADFISLSAPAELGVYQYAAEKVVDGVNNRTNIYYSSTGKLSNSAATVVSLAAAPVDVANLQSDALAKHMNSVRHGKDSGVWVSYFGGENRNTTAAGPEYTLKTHGVMLGADTLTENNWLAGVAVSSARSDMSVMNSSGDLNSYGAQFYMSRRYDSGVFVDSALQFNHFSNTAKARMTDGQQAKADFSGNSYGLEAKVGYAWNDNGFFAEPYVRAAARAFDGEHYALSNGMTVNSNDYKSMLGEVGADVGYQYDISGGYVKPYLHLAALNEFADGNSVRVNNVSLDNSVKGAAFQAGLGAEVKVTDNLGGYAAFDYTKGDNTERPWQATVGVNYTW
ncbi:autotransporter outer membrane beta-barrel domain-containing protein [Salmonella enterica]|nr:autotransporter outer membrane beta-barrel domain-containing protein [Salmonella enterica]EJB9184200.1 autotransporter outer membrane beta-barrel domain-containing protein [Salmonella enterica]EJC0849496.1 autotransporter outer membrane beta-barrel domain-containing protein [Salmonella enterica]EJQ8130031.1 autotransporter outer membrane beta-barrel domain-containing protein [Salmonella enterica]EJQ8459233.1 autotransporter outer membrane beta-barrel domain-containing protein [Salmonella ent